MLRTFICMAAALSLAACAAPGTDASGPASPADNQISFVPGVAPNTIINPSVSASPLDGQAIVVAFQALDAAATAADALIVVGAIKPGSAAALNLANGLAGAKTWLNIAIQAQRAGRASDYITAIAQASAALAGAQAALKGN